MPDATLTRLIRPTVRAQNRQMVQAFTPHPAFVPNATLARLIGPTDPSLNHCATPALAPHPAFSA
ncbi:hypothetical protein ACLB1N_12790 [Escherichia coli]